MGKKGREIVDLDVSGLIEDLTRAYADEWLAHYNYMLAAKLAAGINSPVVHDMLKKRSLDELEHANRIAERIIELGGEPLRTLEQIPAKANCPAFAMPKDPRNLEGILRAVLEAERCAIETYKALYEKTRLKDPVTHELAEDLLADEVADEEETENLLGE